MEREELVPRIQRSVSAVLGHANFEMRDDLTAADVEGWDSLTHMSIITGLEKEFNVKFKLKEINKLKNMGSLIELIQSKFAAA
ncbi:MAG: acyl carrier protein [Flavobacteriales bacterium]|nr:acyl carrier protein [Flavobacteriales bacterium]HRH70324.1 acyl carrier protein [Flavobacteriales bacterium]